MTTFLVCVAVAALATMLYYILTTDVSEDSDPADDDGDF